MQKKTMVAKKETNTGGKKPKIKKSVNAILIATGPLATPALPSFFSTIRVHFKLPACLSRKSHPTPTSSEVPQPRGVATRRAQSLSVLRADVQAADEGLTRERGPLLSTVKPLAPAPTSPLPPIPSVPDPESIRIRDAARGKVVAGEEEEEMDFDKEFGFTDVQVMSIVGQASRRPMALHQPSIQAHAGEEHPILNDREPFPSNMEPRPPAEPFPTERNISPRRIQSAPTGLLKMYDESFFLNEVPDDDAMGHDEEDWDLGLDAHNWIVPSVRAKAERRFAGHAGGREGGLVGVSSDTAVAAEYEETKRWLEEDEDDGDCGLKMKMESWDDDFEADDCQDDGRQKVYGTKGGGLVVPEALQKMQRHIYGDAMNLKKFALHIEDLKLLFLDMNDMTSGLPHPKLHILQNPFMKDLEQIQVLISLGDYAEDKPSAAPPTQHHLRVLAEMLLDPSSTAQDGGKPVAGRRSGVSHDMAEDIVKMVERGNLEFGVELVPALLRHMGPLKSRLMQHVEQVREWIVSGDDDA
ncbi:hypothetical protein DFS34DRAFT_251320 [Phlyctochytrium arcticum]|nr:hypothetical protein DFS34DRAFT_251320 [Phlyctochytrium arcticum]